MHVVIGAKTHSGWAALVALVKEGSQARVVDRRRIEFVDEGWAKQPYHAAKGLPAGEAQALVRRGIDAAYEGALREMSAVQTRLADAGYRTAIWSLLAGQPMPDWSVQEILSVHFRMHRAEGLLFQDAFVRAAEACGVSCVRLPESELMEHASKALGKSGVEVTRAVAQLGKTVGAPWGYDQKVAAAAAIVALQRVDAMASRRG